MNHILSAEMATDTLRAGAVEKIRAALVALGGNRTVVAKRLGIGRRTLTRWMHAYPEIGQGLPAGAPGRPVREKVMG